MIIFQKFNQVDSNITKIKWDAYIQLIAQSSFTTVGQQRRSPSMGTNDTQSHTDSVAHVWLTGCLSALSHLQVTAGFETGLQKAIDNYTVEKNKDAIDGLQKRVWTNITCMKQVAVWCTDMSALRQTQRDKVTFTETL